MIQEISKKFEPILAIPRAHKIKEKESWSLDEAIPFFLKKADYRTLNCVSI